jgi:hypothetical protein
MDNTQTRKEIDIQREDGSTVICTETALHEHTYDKVIADVFQYEGIKVSLFNSEEERSHFRAWLLYSEWACGESPGDYTVDMFKSRFNLYLKDCGCSLVINLKH